MLDRLHDLKRLLDVAPKMESKEIINEDKYLEKYHQRVNTVLTDSWIDAIHEEYDEEERRHNKIGKKQTIAFPFGYTRHKNIFYNKKYDEYILKTLESKREVIDYLCSFMHDDSLDDVSKKFIVSYIELMERIFYADMFEYSKMNAYRIYDNLSVLKALFRDISITFLEKSRRIEQVKNIEEAWDDELIVLLDEYEDYLENLSYELFDVLETILEYMYKFYTQQGKIAKMEKEKAFFSNLFFQVYIKWIPILQKIDKKLYEEN